jgi:hypothetical protein
MGWSGVERNRMKRNGLESPGTEWNGIARKVIAVSGMKWSGIAGNGSGVERSGAECNRRERIGAD